MFLKIHRKAPVPESLCWSEACKFIKKESLRRCFAMNFAKFLKTPFLQDTSGRLLLELREGHTLSRVVLFHMEETLGRVSPEPTSTKK